MLAKPRLAAAVVAVLSTGLLAGCGVAQEGAGFQPGVAAEVGDTRISLDEVTAAAEDRCEVLDQLAEESGGEPIPGARVQDLAVQGEVLREVADQLAEEYDVRAGELYAGALDAIEQQLVDVDADLVERATPALASTDYFVDVLIEVGREDLGLTQAEDPQGQQAFERGLAIAQEWVEEHGLETNPRFSEIRIGGVDEGIVRTRSDLSVTVSDFAQEAAGVVSGEAVEASALEYAQSLPDSQSCG